MRAGRCDDTARQKECNKDKVRLLAAWRTLAWLRCQINSERRTTQGQRNAFDGVRDCQQLQGNHNSGRNATTATTGRRSRCGVATAITRVTPKGISFQKGFDFSNGAAAAVLATKEPPQFERRQLGSCSRAMKQPSPPFPSLLSTPDNKVELPMALRTAVQSGERTPRQRKRHPNI